MLFCPHCAAPVLDDKAAVCPVCGGRLSPEPSVPQAAVSPVNQVPPSAAPLPPVTPNVQPQQSPYLPPQQHPFPSQQDAFAPPAPTSFQDQSQSDHKKPFPVAIFVVVALLIIALAAGGIAVAMLFESSDSPAVASRPKKSKEAQATTAVAEAESLPMPNCEGLLLEEMEAYFAPLDCEIIIEYHYSDTVQEGYIISQNLQPGTTVTDNSSVCVTVSKGVDVCPYEYRQKVVVSAPSGSYNGSLSLYNWENGQWKQVFQCAATVGKNGIGTNYGEGKGVTPQGIFKLGVALIPSGSGYADNWDYYEVTRDTCIVDDVNSAHYNTIRSISALPAGVHYDPIGSTLVSGSSNACIFIEHNGNGFSSQGVVAGRGSVITICGVNKTPKATLGCVDISASNMLMLLSYLNNDLNTHIEIDIEDRS